MKVGIPKEVGATERRVAATPASVQQLQKLGFEVVIETGAGEGAGFLDGDYEKAGAAVSGSAAQVFGDCDVVLAVRPPTNAQIDMMREGATLISFLTPAQNEALVQRLADHKITALAMDQIPRITRAQKMDALSSMANIAGYRAVVEAANAFGRFFTGQMTAAGKVPPAKVLVIGAGVAGLAAIGAARGLGAIVRAFDTRPAVKEQVQSMGAEFLELAFDEEGEGVGGYAKVMSKEFIDAEMALFRQQAREVDIVITTALIPGKKAPTLWTEDMLKLMAHGSVVIDLAAEQGGNCEGTVPGERTVKHGVTIVGYTDLPSRMSAQSSRLYANNLCHLLHDMGGAKDFRVDLEDEVVRGALVAHDGEVMWPPPKPSSPPQPPPKVELKSSASLPVSRQVAEKGVNRQKDSKSLQGPLSLIAGAVAMTGIGFYAPEGFIAHLTVFVLACFIGWQVVWNVTPALHTPLMSVTNAISGIIIVGGMLSQRAGAETSPASILGAIAILIAMINVSGGFLVTKRMLQMFRK
jgi:NAD(P) transhydrogenase subunit alpha